VLYDGTPLYDALGTGFALLQCGGGPRAADRLIAAAADRRVPLAHRVAANPEVRALYGADLVLIRPDQHVAWRGDRIDDADALWRRVTGAT
jgi:hypothetical protein